jgi:hypothetical protein
MNWLAISPLESWKRALEISTWGMTKRYEYFWNHVSPQDTIFFYVTSPVKGVVGYGMVTQKLYENRLLWPEEVREKQVLWPLRLQFNVTHCLPPERWETSRVRLSSKQAVLQRGFQALRQEVVDLILKELKRQGGKRA